MQTIAVETLRSWLDRGKVKETARQLGMGMFADFLVMPANMPHVIQADIEQISGKKVLSMIELTLAEVSQQGHRHVGLLGLGVLQVYLSPSFWYSLLTLCKNVTHTQD